MKADEEYNKEVGRRVKASRGGIKQAVLAKALHCQQPEISMIEHGKRPLSRQDAMKIAKICNVRWEYIFCIDDYSTEEEYSAAVIKSISEFENGLCALTAYVSQRIADNYSEEASSVEKGLKIYHYRYAGYTFDVDGNEMDLIHRDLLDYFEYRLRKKLDEKAIDCALKGAIADEMNSKEEV